MKDLTVRHMRPDEIPLAVDWAAAEGWNPLSDALLRRRGPTGILHR